MSIRTLLIILIILILVPIIMEKVEVSIGDFISHPKETSWKFFQNVFNFYKNSVGAWLGNIIGNIIEEKIKGKKVEIELK